MSLGLLDLNLLRTFEAIYEARSVSAAAEIMGVRQPTVSASLARLRTVFADELFVRAAGAMQPTPKALRIAPGISSALSRLRETLADAVPFSPKEADRTFTVASTDYTTVVLLPAVIEALKTEAPGINLRIFGYDKDDIPELIDRGQIDLALGVFRTPPERAVQQTLYSEHFVGMARRDHPIFSVPGPVSLEAYLNAEHALVTHRRDVSGEIDAVLRQRGLARRIALTLPQMLTLPNFLTRSDLIAAVPSRAAEGFKSHDVRTFEIPLNLATWKLEMLWNPTARSDQASAWLRSKIAGIAKRV